VISIKDKKIIFKSIPRYFQKEESGLKPNTVRIVDHSEYHAILNMFKDGELEEILIHKSASEDHFCRKLTDISYVGSIAGKELVVFSWKHED